jgi:hypothetical protein
VSLELPEAPPVLEAPPRAPAVEASSVPVPEADPLAPAPPDDVP